MTYEKGVKVLQQYADWRRQDGRIKMPRQRDIDDALDLAINTMKGVLEGKELTSPAELRFNSIGQMIEDFIEDNKLERL